MKQFRILAPLFAVTLVLGLAGCGSSEEGSIGESLDAATDSLQKSGEELAKSAGDLAKEAADMAPEEIKSKIEELKKTLAAKEDELKKIGEKLKGMSAQDLTGDDAKKLKAQNKTLTDEVAALKEKIDTWMSKISG